MPDKSRFRISNDTSIRSNTKTKRNGQTHIRVRRTLRLNKNCPLTSRRRSVHPCLRHRLLVRSQTRPVSSLGRRDSRQPSRLMNSPVRSWCGGSRSANGVQGLSSCRQSRVENRAFEHGARCWAEWHFGYAFLPKCIHKELWCSRRKKMVGRLNGLWCFFDAAGLLTQCGTW